MEWTPRPLVEHLKEQERHNVTVITVGSKYEVYVRSPAPSHMLTFRTLTNKVRGNYVVKEVLLASSSCVFLHASFCVRLSLLLLSRYDTAHDYITVAFFYNSHLVFSSYTLLSSMWCYQIVILTQPRLVKKSRFISSDIINNLSIVVHTFDKYMLTLLTNRGMALRV